MWAGRCAGFVSVIQGVNNTIAWVRLSEKNRTQQANFPLLFAHPKGRLTILLRMTEGVVEQKVRIFFAKEKS